MEPEANQAGAALEVSIKTGEVEDPSLSADMEKEIGGHAADGQRNKADNHVDSHASNTSSPSKGTENEEFEVHPDRDFTMFTVKKPESPHLRAMIKASPAKKGEFFDKDEEDWLPFGLKPSFGSRPDPVWPDNYQTRVAVPLYDPDETFKDRYYDTPPDENIRGAVAIYFAGQVRLGSARCTACQERPVLRETFEGVLRPTAPIPVCATAGKFAHGICAPCYLLGGTLAERLARCSVSRMLSYEEYSDLCKPGATGCFGPGIFIGESTEEEEAWVEELLWFRPKPGDIPGLI